MQKKSLCTRLGCSPLALALLLSNLARLALASVPPPSHLSLPDAQFHKRCGFGSNLGQSADSRPALKVDCGTGFSPQVEFSFTRDQEVQVSKLVLDSVGGDAVLTFEVWAEGRCSDFGPGEGMLGYPVFMDGQVFCSVKAFSVSIKSSRPLTGDFVNQNQGFKLDSESAYVLGQVALAEVERVLGAAKATTTRDLNYPKIFSQLRGGGSEGRVRAAFHFITQEGLLSQLDGVLRSQLEKDWIVAGSPTPSGSTPTEVVVGPAALKLGDLNEKLYQAVCDGCVPEVELCLKGGADPHHCFRSGTAFAQAVRNAKLPIVRILMKGGRDINHPIVLGYTPLMSAVISGNAEFAAELLKMGADPNLKNDAGLAARELNEAVFDDAMRIFAQQGGGGGI